MNSQPTALITKVGRVTWLWFIGPFHTSAQPPCERRGSAHGSVRQRQEKEWRDNDATHTHTLTQDITQMNVAPHETRVLGGHSQTDETLLIVTEGWPITRSHADRVQMQVTHWLLGLKSCLHEWSAEWVDRSRSRCSACDPAMLLWFGFYEAGPVISIIVIIFDELLRVALNYCILDPVEAPVLLSDQPFCQHQ